VTGIAEDTDFHVTSGVNDWPSWCSSASSAVMYAVPANISTPSRKIVMPGPSLVDVCPRTLKSAPFCCTTGEMPNRLRQSGAHELVAKHRAA
jgi:hypothetical protein